METRLSESEIEQINKEAEKEFGKYVSISLEGRIKYSLYVKIVTAEREKAKVLIDGLNEIIKDWDKTNNHQKRVIAEHTLFKYNKLINNE